MGRKGRENKTEMYYVYFLVTNLIYVMDEALLRNFSNLYLYLNAVLWFSVSESGQILDVGFGALLLLSLSFSLSIADEMLPGF